MTLSQCQIPQTHPGCSLISGLGHVTHAKAQIYLPQVSYLVDLNTRTVTSLGSLGGIYSSAYGINDAGQVVGNSHTAGGEIHAFIFHHRP
jgi:probable HAF family extracellular repeat protein